MKKYIAACLLTLPLFITAIFAQTPSQAKLKKFQMPAGVTITDYLPGRIYFKVKNDYRTLCNANTVQVPGIPELFPFLNVTSLKKVFPYADRPASTHNELGQRMADITLIYELEYKGSVDLVDAINLILQSPAVEYAEPHYVYQTLYNPNDPDTIKQYYINQTNARKAWDLSRGDSTIAIGILDTGTSLIHPDLKDKILFNLNDTIDGIDNDNDGYIDNYHGWDFGGDSLGAPADEDPSYDVTDHGVIVTGPAAAESDNNFCIASIGFNTKFIPLKTTPSGSGYIIFGYEALAYAADHQIPIVNLSWGGTWYSDFGADVVRYAAINKKILIVVAGGNTPGDYRFFPATYPNVIGVAGEQNGGQVWFNNSGFGSTYNYLLDVTAPARNLQTTAKNSICGGSGGYGTGTSLAAPVVCGASALALDYYPNINPIQAGEHVRVSANDTFYLDNPASTYAEKFGHGRLDCWRALTFASPSVRLVDVQYDDLDNGLIEPGDTIYVRAKFVNYLDPTGSLDITLTTPSSTYLQVIDQTINVGSLSTLDTVSLKHAAFRVKVLGSAPANATAYLRFAYSDGTYNDWEYYPMTIDQSFVPMSANRLKTSIDSKGRYGWHNYPSNSLGRGVTYNSDQHCLSEGGFLVGMSSTQVSDNIRGNGGGQDNDFVNVVEASAVSPGPLADRQGHILYNDNGAASSLNLEINQNVYQYTEGEHQDYIIFEYEITNNNAFALSGLRCGMYADWDLGYSPANICKFDTAGQLIYADEIYHGQYYYPAMGLVSNHTLGAYATDFSLFNFTTASKWTALSSPPSGANSDTTDIIAFVSAGPFNIGAGATEKVAFFMAAGKKLVDVRAAADAAREKYNCVILGNIPKVNLGQDLTTCVGPTSVTLDAGSGYSSYLWSTGQTTQTISVSNGGKYTCEVTNGGGCKDIDGINLTIGRKINAGFTASATNIFIGDTVWFNDTTSDVIGRGWDFGDGNYVFSLDSNRYHVYNTYGNHTVTMYAQNDCRCSDTVTLNIQVDTLLKLPNHILAQNLKYYPNPAHDQLFVDLDNAYRGRLKIRLLNLVGQELRVEEHQKQSETVSYALDLSNLPQGFLLLELSNSEMKRTFKVIRK
ncbi:MAG: S8 family serine peptidase [Bacteroidia bacterium]|nr:S8 family serine peptidase [Bacteroidia bacterium]